MSDLEPRRILIPLGQDREITAGKVNAADRSHADKLDDNIGPTDAVVSVRDERVKIAGAPDFEEGELARAIGRAVEAGCYVSYRVLQRGSGQSCKRRNPRRRVDRRFICGGDCARTTDREDRTV